MYLCLVEILQAQCVRRTTDGSVIAGSSAGKAVKVVKMEVMRNVEEHAYIKIAVLRERSAMECHSELLKDVGNNANNE